MLFRIYPALLLESYPPLKSHEQLSVGMRCIARLYADAPPPLPHPDVFPHIGESGGLSARSLIALVPLKFS
jgi:hypothetical protein